MIALSTPEHISNLESMFDSIAANSIRFIEIQGSEADSRHVLGTAFQKGLTVINSYNYVDCNFFSNIISQKNSIKDKAFDKLNSLITNPLIPENITIDFGFSYIKIEAKQNSAIIEYLHALYKPIYESRKKICLPVRLPGDEEACVVILGLLKQLMSNKFKICLNIFPHEIKDELRISSLISNLKYDIELIRLVYEPSVGNYITEKIVRFFADTIKKLRPKPVIIFAPAADSSVVFEKEISSIGALQKYFNSEVK